MPQLTRLIATLVVAVTTLPDRLRSATRDDRGDNPVSTAIIVAVVAAAAVLVGGAITAAVNHYVSQIPNATP